MVQLLMAAVVVAQSLANGLLSSDCPELVVGKSLIIASSPQRPACINVVVAAGEATQVTAEYTGDVSLRVRGEGKETLVDGFEFGRETTTLITPGQHRIEINIIDAQ